MKHFELFFNEDDGGKVHLYQNDFNPPHSFYYTGWFRNQTEAMKHLGCYLENEFYELIGDSINKTIRVRGEEVSGKSWSFKVKQCSQ